MNNLQTFEEFLNESKNNLASSIDYKGKTYWVNRLDLEKNKRVFAYTDKDLKSLAKINGKTLMFSADDIEDKLKEGFINENQNGGSYRNLKDLMKEINRMGNISFIEIPVEIKTFNPRSERIKGSGDWKSTVEIKLKSILSTPKGRDIDEIILNPYTRDLSGGWYIMLKSPAFRKFSKDMSSGKFGSLD